MKTYEIIFDTLYQKKDFMTGQELADILGVSRNAIWKAIKTLEEHGITFETSKGKGYKWLSGDLLIPDLITKATGLEVSYNPDSLSTQLDAKAGMDAGQSAPRLYLANNQIAARGRMGRDFYAEANGGIYMSLHLKPNLTYANLPIYTILVAGATARAIERLTGKQADIKWVNDIYVEGKKVVGILTEAVSSIETGTITDVIIGMGINYKLTQIPTDLQAKVGSLFDDDSPTVTRNELIAMIWQIFLNESDQDLFKVYRDKSIVLDKTVTFQLNGADYRGIARDITPSGGLLVELAEGKLMEISSGEVSLSSW